MAQHANTHVRHKRTTAPSIDLITRLKARGRQLLQRILQRRKRTAHTLSSLNDHQLRDIGYTRDQLPRPGNHGVFDFQSQRYYDIGFTPRESTDTGYSRITRLRND